MTDPASHFLDTSLRELEAMKRQAERALAQVADDQLNLALDPESNSLALLVKHLAGNMHSRWTDFLTSDGEKPDRERDTEFEGELTRAALEEAWQAGWDSVFGAIRPLRAEDVLRTVAIRGEPHTVLQAIARQLTHYAAHVGQIVFLAKHLSGGHWKSLSIPRGKSREFLSKPRPT